MWQDLVFMVGGFIFAVALVPTIRYGPPPRLSSSVVTIIVLLAFGIAQYSLGLYLAVSSTLLTVVVWMILAFQRWLIVTHQGTVSVLFGCHSIIHSIVVWVAWCKLYHYPPNFQQTICILLHDIGHWGKNYLDNYEEKKQHWELGARVAKRLFGRKGYDLVAGHNSYASVVRSRLHDPDKHSWVIAPVWWMMSNCIFEPKLQRTGCSKRESAIMFKQAMAENERSGFLEVGHEIYMRQWGHYKQKGIK